MGRGFWFSNLELPLLRSREEHASRRARLLPRILESEPGLLRLRLRGFLGQGLCGRQRPRCQLPVLSLGLRLQSLNTNQPRRPAASNKLKSNRLKFLVRSMRLLEVPVSNSSHICVEGPKLLPRSELPDQSRRSNKSRAYQSSI